MYADGFETFPKIPLLKITTKLCAVIFKLIKWIPIPRTNNEALHKGYEAQHKNMCKIILCRYFFYEEQNIIIWYYLAGILKQLF